MELNSSKCKVISFSRKRKVLEYAYSIESSALARVSLINDLGVLFDNELRFTYHIESVVAKAFKMTGFMMRHCWEFRNVETLKNINFALVRSHLEYCRVSCGVVAYIQSTH